jgi:hypothetical protein
VVAKRGRVYGVARSIVTNRPSVMHRMVDFQATHAMCGVDFGNASISYVNKPVESILCLKGACRA